MPPKKEKEETLNREIIVRNFEFFDSDEDEDDNNIEDLDEYDGYDTADEETESYSDLVESLLIEIADVEVIGLKVYKINLHDTRNLELEDKNCNCEFDYDKEGYPIMPDGGEQFLAPFLLEVSKKEKFFKDCIFETNINQKILL